MNLFVDIKISFSELQKTFNLENFNKFKNYFIENKKDLKKFFI